MWYHIHMEKAIRTLEEKDYDLLQQTAAAIWNDSYREMLSQAQRDYMLEKFQSAGAFRRQAEEGYVYRGLFDGDELIGYTGSVLEGSRIFLSKLYLKSDHHGQGLGRMLLEDAISLYPDAASIYLTVNKHNPSYDLYRHWGFEVIDSVVTDIGSGYVMDDYIMERHLK